MTRTKKLTRRQLYQTEYIADLLLELERAEAANDCVAIEGIRDEIAHDRAELRRPGSGVVTPAMERYWRREGAGWSTPPCAGGRNA